MTAPAPPAGPMCDLCVAEQVVMSVMNLADYSTVQIGPGCLPEFLMGILASIGVPVTPAEAPAGPDVPEPKPDAVAAAAAAEGPPLGQPAVARPRRPRAGK